MAHADGAGVASLVLHHDLGKKIPIRECLEHLYEYPLYEMSYPEEPGVLRIVRGYLLTEAMILK